MLTLFKKIFGKSEPKAVVLPVPVASPAPIPTPMPSIEVAHLSLPAIVERLPEEIKATLLRQPDASSRVALPIPTILKQLPTGVVKMSLASLHRQAHGLFPALTPGDKRTVEVPLAEIFRHVSPHSLKRRPDQRQIELPESGFSLFGDSSNPYAVAPEEEKPPGQTNVLDLTPDMPRVLKMDDSSFASDSSPASQTSAPNFELRVEAPPTGPRVIAPPSGFNFGKTEAPTPVIAKPEGPTLPFKVATLAAGWPEELRSEIEALDPETIVTLPSDDVAAGLSKGRVSFTWAQIRAWLEPASDAPTAVAANTTLTLPLKIVAPAFLAASKQPKVERKNVALDESIPALFTDGRTPEPFKAPQAPQELPAPTEETANAPEAAAPAEPLTLAVPEPAPVPVSAPVINKLPETVGEVFQQPHKRDWTPSEIVAGTITLPGVAGAVVALQEGLQVAASLPDGVKSEVVAAFLPQIFARLNQYAGEMRLGDVDDLLFTTHGAHCQIYRLGFVYFAVLGKPGESLPWHELRLISEELARQTNK